MAVLMAKEKPTAKSFAEQLHKQFGPNADAALKLYGASTDEQALRSAATSRVTGSLSTVPGNGSTYRRALANRYTGTSSTARSRSPKR